MIDIEQTANKLKQFGVSVRLKGTDEDKRRILVRKCEQAHLAPVVIGELE